MQAEAVKKFEVNLNGLSERKKQVLEKLVAAAETIAPLYLAQKNENYPGANFYPHQATKEEIDEAARKDPEILHPHTFVEKDRLGRLKPVFYQTRFKKELKQAAGLLKEAAKLSEDKKSAEYLVSMANSLLKPIVDEAERLWAFNGPFDFSFIIGPVERYLDKLYFSKCAYQAWVGIVNQAKTREAEKFERIILASRRRILSGTTKIEPAKLRIEVTKIICFAGQKADFMPTGTNLPNNIELVKKMGSAVNIFETSLDFKFKNDQYPILEKIFGQKIKDSYSSKELYDASLRCILLHEIAHSLIRYQDAAERLKDLFPIFDEILAYVLGIKACGPLLLKDALVQRELEAALIMHLVRHFTWWLDFTKNPDVKHYAAGAAIALNFFLKEGAIKEDKGMLKLDFNKLFIAIDYLAKVLEYHLGTGSYEEAEEFMERYCHFKVFEPFKKKIF